MTVLSEYEAIVVGAGVVGSALAYALSQQGRNVLLLERDMNEPDRIVGELLQPGGLNALIALGLGDCVKGIDVIENFGYCVFTSQDSVKLAYPKPDKFIKQGNFLDQSITKGVSFHHGRFIMKLREACKRQKLITIEEVTVKDLIFDENDKVIGVNGVKKDCDAPLSFHAKLTFIADGCFSKFRKQVQTNDVLVSAVLNDCALPMKNHGHVVLCDPSPVLLYQIGTHDTRVLVDIPGKLPSASTGALKEYMLNHVLPQLPKPTQKSFKNAVESQRLRVMPNSFLTAVPNNTAGLVLLGDAMNMRHPLTGGGMTVGLNDVLLLSSLLKTHDFSNTPKIQKTLTQFFAKRKSHSAVINILAQALYELFSANNDWKMKRLQIACFSYFKKGGACVDEPMGLLSGLEKSVVLLFYHFFAVAFHAMFLIFSEGLIFSSCLEGLKKKDKLIETKCLVGLDLVLSSPVNLVRGIIVVYSAACVILPLIVKELW